MIIAELSIFPTSEGSSVSRYVKKAIEAIDGTGLRYEPGAMSTVIETKTLDQLFDVVKKAHETLISMNVRRIYINLRVDYRIDKELSIDYKKRAVE